MFSRAFHRLHYHLVKNLLLKFTRKKWKMRLKFYQIWNYDSKLGFKLTSWTSSLALVIVNWSIYHSSRKCSIMSIWHYTKHACALSWSSGAECWMMLFPLFMEIVFTPNFMIFLFRLFAQYYIIFFQMNYMWSAYGKNMAVYQSVAPIYCWCFKSKDIAVCKWCGNSVEGNNTHGPWKTVYLEYCFVSNKSKSIYFESFHTDLFICALCISFSIPQCIHSYTEYTE